MSYDVVDLKKQHDYFWIILLVLFATCIIFLFNSSSMTNITGNTALQTISYLKEGSKYLFEPKDIPGVKTIEIEILKDLKNTLIKVERIESVPWTFEGLTYSMFSVDSEEKEKFGKVTFTLKVKSKELIHLGITQDNLFLYSDRKEITLEKIKEEGDYIYYTATAPAMGEFVLGKIAIPQKSTLPSEEAVPESDEKEEKIKEAIPIKEEKKSFWQKFLDLIGFLIFLD